VASPLSLAILGTLRDQPRYAYEMAKDMRSGGHDAAVRVKWGSLYTVVHALHRQGFIEAVGTSSQGRRPERVFYRITAAGRAELRAWLHALISEPQPEPSPFEVALAQAGNLGPGELAVLLGQRLRTLETDIARQRARLRDIGERPAIGLGAQYRLALTEAEAGWIRSVGPENER
jgi:DNA-binding PadR family transcriptional regulator